VDFSAKTIKIGFMCRYSEPKVERFLRHGTVKLTIN